MEITEVKVFPIREEKLKAFVSVVFDRCFMVNDIKIIQGRDGLFISMPSRKKKNGEFKDVAHPLNNETRRRIESQVLGEYERVLAERGEELPAPPRVPTSSTPAPEPAAPAPAPEPAAAVPAAPSAAAAASDWAAEPEAVTEPVPIPPPAAGETAGDEASTAVAAAGGVAGDGAAAAATATDGHRATDAPAEDERAAAGEPATGGEDDPPKGESEGQEPTLEEVQEAHLRDSFWSVS